MASVGVPRRPSLERLPPVAAAYLALALAMTWPLATRLATHVPAGLDDVWQNCWNFWWWQQALVEQHRSPFFTDLLFHPDGAPTVFHTHSPFNMLLGLPLTLTLGPGAAYGFCVLAALWLSALTTYLLARHLACDGRAAFLAGLVFAFFPQHVEETLEHLNLCATQFVPLGLLFFLRLRTSRSWKDALGLGVAFALNALVDWHLGLLLTAVLLALTVFELLTGPGRGSLLARLALSAAVAALLTAPAAWPLLRETFAGLATRHHPYFQGERLDMGIDAAFLFRPHPAHPLLGSLTAPVYAARRAYPNAGFLCYLGLVPCLLALAALVRRAPGARPWGAFLGLTLLLSLGAHPWWDGRLLHEWTLPFAWIEALPVLGAFRTANRVLVLASLALALLAALGWKALGSRSNAAFGAVVALLLLDYGWRPYPLQASSPAPHALLLRHSPRRGAVLDVPFSVDGRRVDNMRHQLTHGRPIAGGYLSVTPPRALRALRRDAVLGGLAGFSPRLDRPRADLDHLRALGFAALVLHKDAVGTAPYDPRRGGPWLIRPEVFAALRAGVESACGPASYEDVDVALFYLAPESPAAGSR